MSSSGENGGGLNSDDQSNKVTSDPNETVSLPVSLSVPCEEVGTDENLLDMNQELLEEIARTNKLYLAEIHVENQQLSEEVLKQTMKNNTALAKQCTFYDKLIFEASKSSANCIMANPPDTNVKRGGKRLSRQEETSEAGSKKIQKLNPEEDRSSEDQKD